MPEFSGDGMAALVEGRKGAVDASMTEQRQANISLGMRKAEYAAENFIPEDSRGSFLEAMKSIAKLASAGKADSSGNMDYGVAECRYLFILHTG